MQAETKFKISFVKELKKIPKSWWVKTQQVALRGTPDILGCVNGQFIALELKVDSKLTRLQEINLNDIGASGGVALEVRPSDQDSVLQRLRMIAGDEVKKQPHP